MPNLSHQTRKRTSTVLRPTRGRAIPDKGISPETRIGRQIKPQPNGCWNWIHNPASGRGGTTVHGRRVSAHRYVYEILVGPVEQGHHLHHDCENTLCVNPAHMLVLAPKDHKARHKELLGRVA